MTIYNEDIVCVLNSAYLKCGAIETGALFAAFIIRTALMIGKT